MTGSMQRPGFPRIVRTRNNCLSQIAVRRSGNSPLARSLVLRCFSRVPRDERLRAREKGSLEVRRQFVRDTGGDRLPAHVSSIFGASPNLVEHFVHGVNDRLRLIQLNVVP